MVILVGGAPSKDGKPVFSPEKDRFYRSFGLSGNARAVTAFKHGVSALVFVPDPQMAENWSNISSSMNRRQFTLLLEGNKRVDSAALFFMHPDAVIEMLKNAEYDWTYRDHDYKPAVLENIKVSCSIEKDNEEEITCKNIVSMLLLT